MTDYWAEVKMLAVGMAGIAASGIVDVSRNLTDYTNDNTIFNIARFVPIVLSTIYIIWKIIKQFKNGKP